MTTHLFQKLVVQVIGPPTGDLSSLNRLSELTHRNLVVSPTPDPQLRNLSRLAYLHLGSLSRSILSISSSSCSLYVKCEVPAVAVEQSW
jgi:hypothetical protein